MLYAKQNLVLIQQNKNLWYTWKEIDLLMLEKLKSKVDPTKDILIKNAV